MTRSGVVPCPLWRFQISNVSPGGGLADGGVNDAEKVCAAVAKELGLPSASYVLPSSTGVIGWRLPFQSIIDSIVRCPCPSLPPCLFRASAGGSVAQSQSSTHAAYAEYPAACPCLAPPVQPSVAKTLQSSSIVPAAKGIVTTDRYPKIRSATVEGGTVVGIAKGAGMIEPNLATMLVYILTDIDVPRDTLRKWLSESAAESFSCISVDSDMSTSDTVVLVSSGEVKVSEAKFPAVKAAITEVSHTPLPRSTQRFAHGLSAIFIAQVCKKLADDVVRNGEGTNHVIQVEVKNAPSFLVARDCGRAVVNSPLFKCAISGNDPNVGRLLAAVGKYIGNNDIQIPLDKVK